MFYPDNERWGFLLASLQARFPEITKDDLEAANGRFKKLEDIIVSKTNKSKEMIHVILRDLYRDNKILKTDEDFNGIDRAQHKPPTSPSNEWKAREDENRT